MGATKRHGWGQAPQEQVLVTCGSVAHPERCITHVIVVVVIVVVISTITHARQQQWHNVVQKG